MATLGQLGRVSPLFFYIEKDWRRDAYNETYLYVDRDCVEDPTVTAKRARLPVKRFPCTKALPERYQIQPDK